MTIYLTVLLPIFYFLYEGRSLNFCLFFSELTLFCVGAASELSLSILSSESSWMEGMDYSELLYTLKLRLLRFLFFYWPLKDAVSDFDGGPTIEFVFYFERSMKARGTDLTYADMPFWTTVLDSFVCGKCADNDVRLLSRVATFVIPGLTL